MPTEKFIITRRPAWAFMGDLTVTITCDPLAPHSVKLGLAVKAAFKKGADLGGANLGGANLGGADLGGANLGGANLRSANLRSADLGGADLGGADLRSANLRSADLGGADLGGADLRSADLRSANLGGADLGGANLGGADLRSADLRSFEADLWFTLSSLHCGPREAQHLVAKLEAGQVDGATYGDPGVECACLVGTIAQPRGVSGGSLDHDSSRPAEVWFTMIRPGDLPSNDTGGGYAARIALEWVTRWCEAHNIDPRPVVA